MTSSVDLHTHSNYSDGVLSPSELVHLASTQGLTGISLTDHDTIEGLDSFMDAGSREGLDTMPGIEISSYFGEKPLHILGYGFDWHHPLLAARLTELQQIRHNRNRKIQERFRALGIQISDEDLALVSEGQIGRPHFAKILCDRNIVSSPDEAFFKFLRKNGLAYVAKEKFSAATAIQCIRKAGGIAVLAHPWCSDHTLATIPLLLNRLKDIGLEGIEAYYPAHSANVQQRLLEMARKCRLLVTGGSDFHGTPHSACLAGTDRSSSFRVPSGLLDELQRQLQAKRQDQSFLTDADE